VARVDGEALWDLERPLEKSCKLELLDFNDEQGKFVFCKTDRGKNWERDQG
jgi:threonyl-tRNA synthetase